MATQTPGAGPSQTIPVGAEPAGNAAAARSSQQTFDDLVRRCDELRVAHRVDPSIQTSLAAIDAANKTSHWKQVRREKLRQKIKRFIADAEASMEVEEATSAAAPAQMPPPADQSLAVGVPPPAPPPTSAAPAPPNPAPAQPNSQIAALSAAESEKLGRAFDRWQDASSEQTERQARVMDRWRTALYGRTAEDWGDHEGLLFNLERLDETQHDWFHSWRRERGLFLLHDTFRQWQDETGQASFTELNIMLEDDGLDLIGVHEYHAFAAWCARHSLAMHEESYCDWQNCSEGLNPSQDDEVIRSDYFDGGAEDIWCMSCNQERPGERGLSCIERIPCSCVRNRHGQLACRHIRRVMLQYCKRCQRELAML